MSGDVTPPLEGERPSSLTAQANGGGVRSAECHGRSHVTSSHTDSAVQNMEMCTVKVELFGNSLP